MDWERDFEDAGQAEDYAAFLQVDVTWKTTAYLENWESAISNAGSFIYPQENEQ